MKTILNWIGFQLATIRKVILYGTTAIREAENWEYLEDQIKIKTNLNLKIYDRFFLPDVS